MISLEANLGKDYKGYSETELISMACDLCEFLLGDLNAELELEYVKKNVLPDMDKIKQVSKWIGDCYRYIHSARTSRSCASVHCDWRDKLIKTWESIHKNGGF